ncbi:interleukin-17C [Pseudorasbora parva]|uniref:interleukin-17C n=1 Tax=Pseudorasbora parva TaxID=51549 RepID=UPI00351EC961
MSKQILWFPLFFGIFFFLSENVVEGNMGCFSKAHTKLLSALLTRASDDTHPHPKPSSHSADTCVDADPSSPHKSERSLSPWRTSTVHVPDMYPKSYEEAKCLCDGCIINGVENMTYNSVPVKKSRLFLKKVPCPLDPTKYSVEFENVLVTVACTCVVPRQ